jgi:leader peptidase (prepilin peptidase)/N-methyltransferase
VVTALLLAGCGLLGLLIGSFLNVVIWRVPRDESIVRPPSHCPGCGSAIRPRDNIPVLSWLLLRGKCRDCGERISARYPAVELLTALVFVAVGWRVGADLGQHVALVAFLVFAAVGVAQALIDIDTRRLPFRVTNVAWATGLVVLLVATLVDGHWWPYIRALIGMAALYEFYDVLAFLRPRDMGQGDVHLAGPIGLFLGWLGWSSLAAGAFLGFLVGGLGGLALIVASRAGMKSRIPYGPYMLTGALLAVLWGQQLGSFYLNHTVR